MSSVPLSFPTDAMTTGACSRQKKWMKQFNCCEFQERLLLNIWSFNLHKSLCDEPGREKTDVTEKEN